MVAPVVDIGNIRDSQNIVTHVMGILNSSPESFYKESVYITRQAVRDRAKSIEDEGGSFVDVGGMSTAPYLNTVVSERVESERVVTAVKAVNDGCNLPISVDTCRSVVAQKALREGAVVINDVTGLKYDRQMARVVKDHEASVILGAYGGGISEGLPQTRSAANKSDGGDCGAHIQMTKRLLAQSLKIASDAKVSPSKIAIDPSIGFFRDRAMGNFYTKISDDWASRDIQILAELSALRDIQSRSIAVSVSNKSFLGRITNRDKASERAHATVAAEAIAVKHGADIIRTHNVAAACDAAAVASRIMQKL